MTVQPRPTVKPVYIPDWVAEMKKSVLVGTLLSVRCRHASKQMPTEGDYEFSYDKHLDTVSTPDVTSFPEAAYPHKTTFPFSHYLKPLSKMIGGVHLRCAQTSISQRAPKVESKVLGTRRSDTFRLSSLYQIPVLSQIHLWLFSLVSGSCHSGMNLSLKSNPLYIALCRVFRDCLHDSVRLSIHASRHL